MGNICKENNGSSPKNYTCGATSSFSPSKIFYIAGEDPLRKTYGWDASNKVFWINLDSGYNWSYDMNLDRTYTSYCTYGNHLSFGCRPYSVQ